MNDDFVENSENQWQKQVVRATQVMQRLQVIYEQIQAFERRYGGTFETLFGHQTNGRMSEIADTTDWKELVEERKRLIEELDRDDIPCGIYAVPPESNAPRVKIRKLFDWCKATGIPLSEIKHRPELVEQFLVYPNKDEEQKKKRE